MYRSISLWRCTFINIINCTNNWTHILIFLLRFASNIKPTKHSHLTLTMGFEMIFQGFQPSDEQIDDLEQGNPINDAEHVRDAEQQRQQHLQQQQQDAVTRTLRYCTQHGSDEDILVKRPRKSTMKRSRKRIMMNKSSPHTHKNNHTLAMVQTVYLPPMQIIQKLMLQRFLKRAQIILIIPKTALLLILPLL